MTTKQSYAETVLRICTRRHMTANDLGAFRPTRREIALQFKRTARSPLCSQNQLRRRASRTARTATPLSDPTRSPGDITPTEVGHLLRRRFSRSEHSLTRPQENCNDEGAELHRDSPSDLYPAQTTPPTPESLRDVANSMRFPCLLYTSPSPRDGLLSRMPSSA